MLALLAGADERRVGERVWPEIERMDPSRREDAVTEFLIISGLRGLESWVLEKARRLMPLSIDVILNNKVLGPAFLKKVEEESKAARAAALVEGRTQGRLEGERAIARRVVEARFGPLSAEVETRLRLASATEIEQLVERALAATSMEELFPSA